MKLSFVSDAIYPYNKGGKEKRLYDITTRLSQKGYDVHIYCMKWWKTSEKDREENGVQMHAICPYIPLYSGERRSIRQGILFGLSCFKLLFHTWDVIDVDHMPFFPVIFTKIVCILKRKKMIATWHEVWGRDYWIKYMGWKGNISYLIEKLSVLLPDEIISVTDNTTQRIKKMLKRNHGVTTIFAGIDLQHINSIKPSPIHSDIIFVGRLLQHKNIDLIINALQLLKSKNKMIRAIIIGNGPEKKKLLKLTEKYQLNKQITFYDFLSVHDQVLALIKSSKLFVFPSEREGFGLVALEANACGIPFITSSHPDNAAQYLIESNNGFIFDLNNESLAKSISENVAGHQDKKTYLEAVKKYDWNKTMKQIAQLYSL